MSPAPLSLAGGDALPALTPLALTLATHAARMDAMKWMLGTSGSVSARLDQGDAGLEMLISVSGKGKGDLAADDFLFLQDVKRIAAQIADPQASSEALFKGNKRPSGETLVHAAIYEAIPEARAVYHVHSVEGTLCSGWVSPGQNLVFEGLEMLKGLGQWTPGAKVALPVVTNDPNIPGLASLVGQASSQEVPGVLVQGHGIYVWGQDPARALRHVEIFEFLFAYEVQRKACGMT